MQGLTEEAGIVAPVKAMAEECDTEHSQSQKGGPYLKAAPKAALPTADEPNEMQRTSAVGHCTAAHVAARVATDPPTQNPTHTMRLGATFPAPLHSNNPDHSADFYYAITIQFILVELV